MKRARAMGIGSIFPAFPAGMAVPVFVAKELRAIMPAALGGVALFILVRALAGPMASLSIMSIYALSCSAIGALAAGHDFNHRTVGMSLTLPISRAKVWRTRLGLAFLAMAAVGIVTVLLEIEPLQRGSMIRRRDVGWSLLNVLLTPMLTGLLVAPWLTLVSRSALFGAVFSVGLPSFLGALGNALPAWIGVQNFFTFSIYFTWISLAALWIFGGVFAWRKFAHMEAIDGAPMDVGMGFFKNASHVHARPRRRNPYAQALIKELMLQRMILPLAALSAGGALVLNDDAATIWCFVFPFLLSALIGAIASAEERRLGTAQCQILLPMAFWKQWAVKAAICLGLAMGFGVVLPVVLMSWKGLTSEIPGAVRIMAPMCVMATALSLHVSSISQSALKALFGGLTAAVTCYILLMRAGPYNPGNLFLIACLGIALMAIYFAMQNHREDAERTDKYFAQVGFLAAYWVVLLAGWHAFGLQ